MNPLQTDPDTIEIPTADEGIYKVGVRRDRTEARGACLIDCITMLSAACGYKDNESTKAVGALRMIKDKHPPLKEVCACGHLSLALHSHRGRFEVASKSHRGHFELASMSHH